MYGVGWSVYGGGYRMVVIYGVLYRLFEVDIVFVFCYMNERLVFWMHSVRYYVRCYVMCYIVVRVLIYVVMDSQTISNNPTNRPLVIFYRSWEVFQVSENYFYIIIS